METQEDLGVAANILIAGLNQKIEEQNTIIAALQRDLGITKDLLKQEKIKHSYLETMYDELLDKVLP